MRLHQIGELKLLKEVRERFSSASKEDSSIIVGIGDDAAVIVPQKERIIVTTDMMNEGVHFDLSYTSPFHLGFKLVSVNVSDIMAMGGQPMYIFLTLSMKKDTEEEFFWGLYEGVSSAMDIYGVKLLGGDMSAAENDMVVSATVIGQADKIITRGGASVGDKIYITSTLGDSACGLALLQRLTDESRYRVKGYEFRVKSKKQKKKKNEKVLSLTHNSKLLTLNWSIAEPLIAKHLMPVARDSAELRQYATSMIDVSDGLFIDLSRICDESNAGAIVYSENIPISKEMKDAAGVMGLDPFMLATSGGEDYELLFTAADFPVSAYNKSHNIKVSCIGHIVEKKRIVVDKTGKKTALKVKGYQHFGSQG
jgi:thiamine-monophosphate kinase